MRALAHGRRVVWASFLKTAFSGETELLRRWEGFRFFGAEFTHPLFYPESGRPSPEAVAEDQDRLLAEVAEAVRRDVPFLLVMDEVLNAVAGGFLAEGRLKEALAGMPEGTEVVLTGRPCPDWLREAAHLVTRFEEERHYFRAGVPGREGIEW